jgi:hypothetical protein
MFSLNIEETAEFSAFAELSAKQQSSRRGFGAAYGEIRLSQEESVLRRDEGSDRL